MGEAEGDAPERARRARIERAISALRALRQSGMSEAEEALSKAIDRMIVEAAARPGHPTETGATFGVEEETTPAVECVRRERAPHS